jgi:hypothetical protein
LVSIALLLFPVNKQREEDEGQGRERGIEIKKDREGRQGGRPDQLIELILARGMQNRNTNFSIRIN